jgi:biotin carboxylase
MKRILIVAATTGYQTRSFEQAARNIGLDVVLATDRCHQLDDPWGDNALAIRFEDPHAAVQTLLEHPPPDAILAIGDRPTIVAALAAREFGLPYHSIEAVEVCRNKHAAREQFSKAGLFVPYYFRVPVSAEAAEIARTATYPCVLKPLGLSGSRGVIRADDSLEFGSLSALSIGSAICSTLLTSADCRMRETSTFRSKHSSPALSTHSKVSLPRAS